MQEWLPPQQEITFWEAIRIKFATNILVQLVVVILDAIWRLVCVCRYRQRRRCFVLVSSPRMGSTLLVDLLNAVPGIACRGEIFNPRFLRYGDVSKSPRWRVLLHLRAMFAHVPFLHWLVNRTNGISQTGQTILGAKLFHFQMLQKPFPSLGDVQRTLGRRSRILVLYRRNLLEAFVSLKIALANDRWFSTRDANDCSAIYVDPNELREYIQEEKRDWQLTMHQIKSEAAVGSREPSRVLSICYEDLVAQTNAQLRHVCTFLGATPQTVEWMRERQALTGLIRQNPLSLREKISNYAEIRPMIDSGETTLVL